jgi:tetratricopeptide (TPR) repeat protein
MISKSLYIKFPMALRYLLFLFVLESAFGQSKVDQAQKLYEANKYPEVISLLSGVKKDDKDFAGAQYWLGRVAYDQKRLDDAEEFFEEAVDANEKSPEYHNWLGNAYAEIAQNANVFKQGILAPKMKSQWEKAVELSPTYLDPRKSLIQFYLKAPGFMGGSVDKAKETANQIMKINVAEGHLQMGNIYVNQKKIPEAEKEYQEMVKADPAYTFVLAGFYTNQKQYDRAFAFFEDAIKKDPQDMRSTYQFGRVSAISGMKLERGEEYLRKYLTYSPKANEPSLGGANMRLAQIVEKKGNKIEAKRLYETALKLDANLKEATEGLQRTSK